MRLKHLAAIIPILLLFSSCVTTRSATLIGTPDQPIVLAGAVTSDTTLSGAVTISEDLLVPAGVTLAFDPGTRVTVVPSEGTRTDSQFVTTETEIVVRGTLRIDNTTIGTTTATRGSWGGIIATSPDAKVNIEQSTVTGAQYGLMMLAGTAQVSRSTFKNNEVGMAAALGVWIIQSSNSYVNNGIATAAWHTVNSLKSPTDMFEGNDDNALALTALKTGIQHRELIPTIPSRPPVTREYMGEVALSEDTVWSGTVIIDGQVAVPAEVTLEIEPGTHVLFSFRDTNGDGLGESWIIVQGTIRVMGEEDAWVIFDSDERTPVPGSWDSLSVIASDSADNVVQYALFRHGVKAFHNHFSKAHLSNVIFEDNLRGVQFQESEGTVIDGALFRRNQSGARFRDSVVSLTNVVAVNNVAGINFLRSDVSASDIVVTGSFAESFVARESDTELVRAAITGNVRGPRFKGDGQTVSVREAAVTGNLTEGVSFNNVAGSVRESTLSDNGFTGLSVTDASVTAYGNRITGNGRFDVDNNGSTTIDARENDWGTGEAPDPSRIYDGNDEDGIGNVLTGDPARFQLLLPGMEPDMGLVDGELLVVGDVITSPDRDVHLAPGASVLFSEVPTDSLFDLYSDHPAFPSSELHVIGKLEARGTADNPITFAPARQTIFELGADEMPGKAQWGAVNLTGGKGAVFTNCLFFRAATGIHAREAGKVTVKDSVFTSNLVGLRFSRSDVSITDNVFELNNAGIRFHENGGLVSKNLFDSNAVGIFVTDLPENVTISDNIFEKSINYHIKLGIHVTEDVAVQGGEFDLPEGNEVGDLIFDQEDDSDLGRVIILP